MNTPWRLMTRDERWQWTLGHWRAFVPALSAALAILLMTVPVMLPLPALPHLGFLGVACWALFQAELIPTWVAFLLGLLADAVLALPFGVNATLLPLLSAAIGWVMRRFGPWPFVADWLLVALLSLPYAVLEWRLLSFVGVGLPFAPLLVQAGTTALAYPAVAAVCTWAPARLDRAMRIRTEADREHMFSRRAVFLGAAQAGVGLMLAGRMAWLSIFEQEKYRLLAESNQVSLRLIPPRRGWIVDRAGKPLALNRPDYRLELVAEQVDDLDQTLAQIARLLRLTPADLARIRADVERLPGYVPVEVAGNLPWEQFSSIAVRLPELPGVQPVRGFSRLYPDGAAFGHLLGYVGAPTREQYLETRDPLLMFPGYRVGKDGLEKTLDPQLRGKAGARRVEVNARGRILRDLETQNDRPGDTVKLTIDRDLQAFAARRVGDLSASVVVIDCQTGDLLCLLSSPAYDPNVFSRGIPSTLWRDLMADDHHPLINKSVQGLYPPGSTFKITTALAALEAGISPQQTVFCNGTYRLGNHVFHCVKHSGHGTVDMHRAIMQSCDVYFYTMGRATGIDRLAAMGKRLGWGQHFDLPISSMRDGIMPTPEWKRKRFSKDWMLAETINAAIGQGYTIATPLQLAVVSARLASGLAVMPNLIAGQSKAPESLGIPPEHLAVIHAAMGDVVNSRGGTAYWAKSRSDAFQFAGKTGSAQVRAITMADRRRGYTNSDMFPWKYRDHALFISFAPVENPRYACACIVEHGSHGNTAAAPIARDVLTYLFEPATANRALDVIEADRSEKKRKAEAAVAAANAAEAVEDEPPPATVDVER